MACCAAPPKKHAHATGPSLEAAVLDEGNRTLQLSIGKLEAANVKLKAEAAALSAENTQLKQQAALTAPGKIDAVEEDEAARLRAELEKIRYGGPDPEEPAPAAAPEPAAAASPTVAFEEAEPPDAATPAAAAAAQEPEPDPEPEEEPAPPPPALERAKSMGAAAAASSAPVLAPLQTAKSAPAAVMKVSALEEIQKEGARDEPLTDEMFEACRLRVDASVIAAEFKVIGDSKFAVTHKDKDKSLPIRTFIQLQKPLGYTAKDAFELRTSQVYEQTSDSAIKNFEELRKAEDDPSGLGQSISYQMYKMPPGIENRDFLTLRRCIRNEDTNVYEMLSRSVDWPSKPAGTHTKFRATVFAYTRVEPLAGKPHAHICTTLTYTDLKGGLQQKMAGQMEKAMVRRADDGAKAMIKELTKAEGKPKPL